MKKAPLLALLVLLSGCALGATDTQQNYVLAAPVFEQPVEKSKGDLVVLPPEVGAGLDTTRIAVIEDHVRLSYLADAKWATPLPDLLQSVLTETLRKNGFASSASTDATGIKADLSLAVTVPAFQAERQTDGSLLIRVVYEAKELAPLTHKVLKTARAEATKPVAPQTQTDLISAFDATNAEALGKLLALLASARLAP